MIINGLARNFGQAGADFSIVLLVFFGTALISAQGYCLLYRLTVVLDNKRYYEMFMSKFSFIFFHCLGVFFVSGTSIPSFYSLAPKEDFFPIISKYPESLAYIQPDSIFICINTNQTYAAVTGLSILSGTVLAESVSFAVAFGIIKTLRANVESFSAKTYKMHLQLTFLLIAQLSTPILFVLLPVLIGIMAMYFHFHLNKFMGQIGVILCSSYASTNSLLVILFVTPYRNYSKNVVRKIFKSVFFPK
uniref:Uncharacterized protein n=1 Tax=Ditylenchus dipsaci TaxID=166011 RepID=A0A915DBE0_9BILA